MKGCSSCGVSKPLEAFQVRRASNDGRTASCRDCLQSRDRARYSSEREARLEGQRQYRATEAGKAAHVRAVQHWWHAKPERRAAHVAVGNALRDGRLRKDPCHCCGALEAEAHHPDYAAPLSVVWLCRQHHRQLHEEHDIFLRSEQTFC